MPSFIVVLPRKRRLYSGAARDSQLVCTPIRRGNRHRDREKRPCDSIFAALRAKNDASTPVLRNSIRLSVATSIESRRFVGTGGLKLMKMKRKRAKAAASKGAAKKAPKRKKATKRKKAKKK
jgi:hypothetical protein